MSYPARAEGLVNMVVILSNPKLGSITHIFFGGGSSRGVMVIIVGNGHSDTSSNPGQD